jgi:hypothetical protein
LERTEENQNSKGKKTRPLSADGEDSSYRLKERRLSDGARLLMLSRRAEFEVLLALETGEEMESCLVEWLARVALRTCKAAHAIGWGFERGGSRNLVH